jgi:hypothetical protein
MDGWSRRSAICAKTWSFVAGWLDWEAIHLAA